MVRLHLSWLVTIVVMMTVMPSIRGDCAAVDPNCYCRSDGVYNNIYCKDLGDVSQVPLFQHSNALYSLLVIEGKTTLSTVHTGAFNGLKVKKIRLSKIGITAIQSEAFSNLNDTLEYLYLDHNKLETMPEDVFDGLGQLKTLYLGNNQLKIVIPSWFSQLPALEYLYPARNQFDSIPDKSFNKLHKLKSLLLHSLRLKAVSTALFSQLIALESLSLSLQQSA